LAKRRKPHLAPTEHTRCSRRRGFGQQPPPQCPNRNALRIEEFEEALSSFEDAGDAGIVRRFHVERFGRSGAEHQAAAVIPFEPGSSSFAVGRS
jgi:hypothetical protein